MQFRLAISATFTAEPIEPVLNFWARQLQTPFEIRLAPYNQIAQTLTEPASEFASNERGVNVVLARLEDLAQFEAPDAVTLPRLESNLAEVIRLVREALPGMSVPLIFVLCPPSEAFLRAPARRQFAHEMALRIETLLEGTPGILYLSHEEIQQLYPVGEPSSAEGERLGRIPYTELYFCALGTALVRLTHGLFSPPLKVIALDCDNTLWKGICGEDGPLGVRIDHARRALQEFMKEQHDSGMLLVMSSKNNEADVLETFAKHPEMPLQLHHFVGWRLNWDEKSLSLRSLANELSLGLDSFSLVDDNPKECAEAAESIPQMLAVALPEQPDGIPHFLNHIWAFDHVLVTEEDRNRSAHYKTSLEFGRELKRTSNLESFVNALDLHVEMEPCSPGRLSRVAQLTQRTNQFNFTTIRRTQAELGALLAESMECLTVNVSDRFGDYGLTGVVLFRAADNALAIDTLLLSCRVLGRGVEHRVLAKLGDEAIRRGLPTVSATLASTAKNEPARRFLQEIGARFQEPTATGFSYRIPAAELHDLQWKPSIPDSRSAPVEMAQPQPVVHKRPDYVRIATALSTPVQIFDALRRDAAKPEGLVPQGTEARLAQIWSELLHKSGISSADNFFDLGGHSLLAVLLIVRVRETFGVELAIDDVYTVNLTLGELAGKIERDQLGHRSAYAALYEEIDSLSDEEVKQLLAAEDPGLSLP